MRFIPWLFSGLLAAGAALNAQSPNAAPSVEAKVSRLEIRRVGKDPRDRMSPCGALKRSAPGFCTVERFGSLLEFAFRTNQLRIRGPAWMAADDFYLLYFAYDVEGHCPTILRGLAREILMEELSLTVHRERREASVLAMRVPAQGSFTAVSKSASCDIETSGPDDDWLPARKAGIPWGIQALVEAEQNQPSYLGRSILEEPRLYRGCTLTEVARLLERKLYTEVLNETGDMGRYDFVLDTRSFRTGGVTPQQVAEQLTEQLGLDAHVEKRQIEHLVFDGPQPPKKIEYRATGPVPPAPCPAY